MLNHKIFCYLSLAICLVGCTAKNFKANLQNASICCAHPAEIKYQALNYDEPIDEFVGDEDSPVRLFGQEKSFFLGVSLPVFTSAYEIQIKSKPVQQALFMPQGILLDKDFQIAKRIEANSFKLSNGMAYYNFFINKDEGLRYLVLYTSRDVIGIKNDNFKSDISTTPISTGNVTFMYSEGTASMVTVTTAEGGHLIIEAKKYQPAIVRQ